jgi:hypothetical protein
MIDREVDVDALEILADKGQSGVGTEAVGQLFNNEIGHVEVHPRGEKYMRAKLSIPIGKNTVSQP